jgi:hypothetical protein
MADTNGMSNSRWLIRNLGRLVAVTLVVAVAAWVLSYAYLVKIAGYPCAGFFMLKMATGCL